MADQYKVIGGFDRSGVILDSDPFSLGDSELSNCRNVRYDNRSVSKITGEQTMLPLSADPLKHIYWNQPGGVERWVYVTTNGDVRTAIPGVTPNATISTSSFNTNNPINLSLFNGGATLLVNDGVSIPKFIHSDGVSGAGTSSQQLTDFPGWIPSGSPYSAVTARVVRPFRNTIMAANLTFTPTGETGNARLYGPSTIRVSGLAPRGGMPNWNATYAGATTQDEFDLGTNSDIIDMLPLGNNMAVYTTDSIFFVTLTGSSTLPIAVSQQTQGRGLLSLDCAMEFYGRHFVVGNEDIYLFGGGSSIESVADGKVRDYFFRNLKSSAKDMTHVTHVRDQSEIWINYVTVENPLDTCDEALIYNYDHKTWSIRDLPNVNHVAYGATVNTSNVLVDAEQAVVFAAANGTDQELIRGNIGNSFRGDPINAFVERRGLIVANEAVKEWLDSIYFLVNGTRSLEIKVRPTNEPGKVVDFDSTSDRFLTTRNYRIDGNMANYKVDPRDVGRYFNVRIGSNDNNGEWQLIRYNLAYSIDDER